MMRSYLPRIFFIAAILVLLGLLYWGWSYIRRPTSFPFRHVHISSPVQYVDAKQLQQKTLENLKGGFFSLDVQHLKQALLDEPWVSDISFQREWPDTLDIVVQEKQPEARWGEKAVISNQGDLFYPPENTIPKGLSVIHGPDTQSAEILTNFQKLSDDLQLLGLRIVVLNVEKEDGYRLMLSNGIEVTIGRDDIQKRFHRFVALYPKMIGKKSDKVASVDLRYSNGIAVKWKGKL